MEVRPVPQAIKSEATLPLLYSMLLFCTAVPMNTGAPVIAWRLTGRAPSIFFGVGANCTPGAVDYPWYIGFPAFVGIRGVAHKPSNSRG